MNADAADQRHDYHGAIWAVTAAFGCYFCMYAFRKPLQLLIRRRRKHLGHELQNVASRIAVFGYTVSKFVGVKVISEMTASQRPRMLVILILIAELALLLFAIAPRPWNAFCLFLNGLPLGMVFGLVLGQLEGRRLTEALTAGLCTSFILSDGICKSVGKWLLDLNVPENWMPVATGAIFLPAIGPICGDARQVKPPSDLDQAHRSERTLWIEPVAGDVSALRLGPGAHHHSCTCWSPSCGAYVRTMLRNYGEV